MKQQLSFYIIVGILCLGFLGCDKNDNQNKNDGVIEFYLLDTFAKIDNSCQIDETTVITESSPLVYYSDILSYDSADYTFELSDRAIDAIENLEHSVIGLAFAVKANNILIYTGYFWPSYSSASCDWIVMDPTMLGIGNKIQVRLGYPGLIQGQIIPDKRNDKRIINILESDNKLKK